MAVRYWRVEGQKTIPGRQLVDLSGDLTQVGGVGVLTQQVSENDMPGSRRMIYRVGINGPLAGLLAHDRIFLISAVIFGLARYQDMPNGITRVILAGLLGYILRKSVHETSGIFWAWFIHFMQDVIIIGSIYLIKSS